MQSIASEQSFIFIDGSYFLFHRYYSILRWWKNAHPEDEIGDPFTNPIFVEKFRKTLVNNVKNIAKNINIEDDIKPIIIIGKDCKRENIWRNEFYNKYKATRDNTPENGFMGKPFFKMAYNDNLFQEGGATNILHHPKLEADDCIALSVKQLLSTHANVKIYIITSDKDYLQLVEPRVQIFNLAFKNIAEQKSSFGNAEADLFCKIVMGDPSDNIPSVLSKCGPKTALKCYQDKEYFDNRMKKENAYEKFELNKKIIDFNCIPQLLIDEFYNI